MTDARTRPSTYSLADLCRISGGYAIGAEEHSFTRPGVDSRTIQAGQLFVALPGERADGHNFLGDVFARGVRVALVSHAYVEAAGDSLTLPKGCGLCAVPDTLTGLQELARTHLRSFSGLQRIAITGSNGKTTTKELLAAVLSQAAPTFATAGNYNSEIGVPLAIFDLQPEQRFGVFEVAMNRPGEIAVLANLVRPEIALITNIGSAHVGNLGGLERIAEEKKQVFSCFDGSQVAFVYEDDAFASFLLQDVEALSCTFGPRSTAGFEGYELRGLAGSTLRYYGLAVQLPLPGAHNVRNALAAISVAAHLGLSPEQIRDGLERVPAMFGRGEILSGPVTVLRDCYNANPDSMREALTFVAELVWPGRRVVVIGAMKELGGETEAAHAEVVALALAAKPQALFLVGEEFAAAFETVLAGAGSGSGSGSGPELFYAPSAAAAELRLGEYLRDGDFVLLKGSRSMALEELAAVCARVQRSGAS